MGIILKTNPSVIRPSQDFLTEDTLNFIKRNFEAGDFGKLPPAPVVRKDENGRYVAIDGHNILAFYSLKNMECDVYVAERKEDKLEGDSEMIVKRNQDLFEKYELVLEEANVLRTRGISTINDLCKFTKVSV